MVLTKPMALTYTTGLELLLLKHTCTKGMSVASMQDFHYSVETFHISSVALKRSILNLLNLNTRDNNGYLLQGNILGSKEIFI